MAPPIERFALPRCGSWQLRSAPGGLWVRFNDHWDAVKKLEIERDKLAKLVKESASTHHKLELENDKLLDEDRALRTDLHNARLCYSADAQTHDRWHTDDQP